MGDVTISVKKEMNFSCFFWTADYSGCGYYRCALPAMAMRDNRWLVDAGTNVEDKHFYWDMIVAQRTANPPSAKMIEIMVDSGMPVVYEVDDLILDIDRRNPSYNFFQDKDRRKAIAASMKKATAIIVTNDYLKKELRDFNDNIYVIPNYIDERMDTIQRPSRDDNKVIVGWAGGPSHDGDWDVCKNAIVKMMNEHENVVWHSIGYDYGAEIGISEDRRIFSPWQTDIIKYYSLIDFDIGIAPLAKTRFNKSKSPIKALEYAAFAIPCIATATPPYSDFIRQGDTGILVKNSEQWTNGLSLLINDVEARTAMGRRAQDESRLWTAQGNSTVREEIFGNLINDRTKSPQDTASEIFERLDAIEAG